MSKNLVTDGYDIDLRSSGAGWVGTFSDMVANLADNILSDGYPWPIELTLQDGTVVTGKLTACDRNSLSIEGVAHRIGIDENVVRVRA
jgi:hypothetical protein